MVAGLLAHNSCHTSKGQEKVPLLRGAVAAVFACPGSVIFGVCCVPSEPYSPYGTGVFVALLLLHGLGWPSMLIFLHIPFSQARYWVFLNFGSSFEHSSFFACPAASVWLSKIASTQITKLNKDKLCSNQLNKVIFSEKKRKQTISWLFKTKDWLCLKCNWWSWHCATLQQRELEIGVRSGVFASAAVLSGVLYFCIIRALRNTRQSARKTALARAFVALWLSWLFCLFPYQTLELFYLEFRKSYTYLMQQNRVHDPAPMMFKDLILKDNDLYTGAAKRFIIVEAFLGVVMFSYGFLNSVLLLVLLKPFWEPAEKLLNKLRKKCGSNKS